MSMFARTLALSLAVALVGAMSIWPHHGPVEPPDPAAFVTAEGQHLTWNGSPFRFKSVGFSNYYTYNIGEDGFSLARSPHHSESDFAQLGALGFNSVRFAFNGNWFRDDPHGFWRWLDRNIGWAEAHGVLLTLDLHIPIGGDWLAPSNPRGDFRIWTDDRVRAENIALWRSIADRYRDEPTIAAYDILNEPVTADSTGDQWRRLAEDLTRTIREVDPNHLLIVGPVYGVERGYTAFDATSQFLIDDPNVLYDFHFYEPFAFTHQTASWLEQPIADGGPYPDPDQIIPTGRERLLPDIGIESQSLPEGRSDWRKYQSDWQVVDDDRAVAGLPVATFRGGAVGTVSFDDLEIFEYDAASRTTRRVAAAPLTDDALWDWWPWGSGEAGAAPGIFTRSNTAGSNDDASLKIAGQTEPGGYLGWSSDSLWFSVTPGNSYRVSGFMQGDNVAYPDVDDAEAFIGIALDFYADPPGATEPGFLTRGRDLLEQNFLELYAFGRDNNVPMSVMEFGTIRTTFTAEKGGARWIGDMLDIFTEYDVSFSLWNYHGPSMGIFLGDYGQPPGEPNQPLIEVLKQRLADPGE